MLLVHVLGSFAIFEKIKYKWLCEHVLELKERGTLGNIMLQRLPLQVLSEVCPSLSCLEIRCLEKVCCWIRCNMYHNACDNKH